MQKQKVDKKSDPKKKNSVKYFKVDVFVDDVIEQMKLGNTDPEVLIQLQNSSNLLLLILVN